MQKKTARREFIKQSSLLAGGLLLPGIQLPGAYAAGTDQIKIALIGCGGRGTGAAFQALQTDYNIQLVAMADAFRDRIDKSYEPLIQKFGSSKIQVPEEHKFVGFEGYKAAIALADVVILATPPGFRPSHFEEAVRQGKQVFMEKPVAVDAVGVRKVLAAAESAKQQKLNVVVGLQRHYQDNYLEVIKRLQDGAVGDITGGQVYWNDGGVWVNPRQQGQTEMEYQMRNWYYFNWLCGDHINEQHIHNIDVANWVKGAYPVSAYGTGGRQIRTGKDHGEIFDHHSITFTYPDGSVIFSECRHFPGAANRVDESFQGTKGKIYLSAANHGVITDWKGKTIYEHDRDNNPNPYQVEHDQLFAAVSEGAYRFADAENAAKSGMTAILGRFATYTGQVIKWEDAMASEMDLMPDQLDWDALPKVLPNEDGYYPHAVPGKTKFY